MSSHAPQQQETEADESQLEVELEALSPTLCMLCLAASIAYTVLLVDNLQCLACSCTTVSNATEEYQAKDTTIE
eukprot:3565318-Amphidinium_carterae.1